VKKHGKDRVHYWRNRNQNEIDFILEINEKPMPIEVKMNFGNFRALSMNHFLDRYGIKEYRIVGLEGKKKDNQNVYPWEL
jgi:predicted AAA+ superfamily ATPase